ncbi:hypothetical protein A2767_06020 [Candidatus Roizmanbacteria bacterium RIFCSPHIGHO2_01_FULL_35_10]|uniref:Uncharacterized protein n=1 Tax=Candidatus Roizmanbacteria bacterium RIFCSPLOWO2_01_FULL_35_13 TaxID=1802055 RepID=A0A1F7IHV5_9BACT|nr:MAG: hypothetical protein A2767_06020 [Candidatus Roizmanbacteria bacterium RIFCSPHIGHO2_01_FULL_35_10]OGK42961.1 MAG: hypothetical protein A3A74_05840 [Candidatus Roizmanbacteria bacterium RIFCSPLOWO2_01_FULL_35_13]
MGNNRIVIIILVLAIAGTLVIGLIPKSPAPPPSSGSNTQVNSPTFSQVYNLPSLIGLAIWPTATPLPIVPTGTNPVPTTPGNPNPTPMSIGTVRPGSGLQEIAAMAEAVSCTPAALILAIKTQETQQRFFTTSTPAIFRFYNTYGWWKPPLAGAGDSCYGYSYNTITGLIAPDAAGAGTRCANAVGNPSAASQGIMGLMQINQSEQNSVTAKFQQFFKGATPDRRVLFDAMVLGGFLYKNLSTQTTGCELNWSIKDIAIVSCRFYGACTDNYCENVCKYYGDYGGQKFNNCANISSLVVGSPTGCKLK